MRVEETRQEPSRAKHPAASVRRARHPLMLAITLAASASFSCPSPADDVALSGTARIGRIWPPMCCRRGVTTAPLIAMVSAGTAHGRRDTAWMVVGLRVSAAPAILRGRWFCRSPFRPILRPTPSASSSTVHRAGPVGAAGRSSDFIRRGTIGFPICDRRRARPSRWPVGALPLCLSDQPHRLPDAGPQYRPTWRARSARGRPGLLARASAGRPARHHGGVALVLMETINDIGVAEYLGVRTLTAAVYTTWINRGSLEGAAQIAC